MNLSVLILTHNRPKLFTRCLLGLLAQVPTGVEIIVNNDSNDISEIAHPQVTYYYNKFDSLCGVYKFLLETATKEYVYYLEDDDYLANEFFNIALDYDLSVGNYYPTYNVPDFLKYLQLYNDDVVTPKEFVDNLDIENLQLSQHIFKREHILDFDFKMDSNIHNDTKLVVHAASKAATIKTMNKVFYFQTIDGGDNISFNFK